jgi:hypothetical protein
LAEKQMEHRQKELGQAASGSNSKKHQSGKWEGPLIVMHIPPKIMFICILVAP